MATVALSTSSATLDPGTAYELTVLNSGTVSCHVQIGGGVGYDERLRPGQQTIIYPNGSAVTAFVRSGTGEVTTALSTNPETASGGGGAFLTTAAASGTYGPAQRAVDRGAVLLDSFAGATYDDKLSAALTYAAAQTIVPEIAFPTTDILLTQSFVPFTGMRLVAARQSRGPMNPEQGNKNAPRVKVQAGLGTSSLFVPAATVYDVHMSGICFHDTESQSQFWHQPYPANGSLYASEFHDLTFYGFKHIFGNPTTPCPLTQVVFSGFWQIIGGTGTQLTIIGSDNSLWMGGMLNIGGGVPVVAKAFLIDIPGMSKTDVGVIYLTVTNTWRGMRVTGASAKLNFFGGEYEGLSGAAANGNLILVNSADATVTFYSPWIGYAMGSPDATEHGAVEVTAGSVRLVRPVYDYATGQTAGVPSFAYVGGGILEVDDPRGRVATDTPRVEWASGTLRPMRLTGTGDPNGVVSAYHGTQYFDLSGGPGSASVGATMYVKETSGYGNSGWSIVGSRPRLLVKTASYTLTTQDQIIVMNSGSGTNAILPSPNSTVIGRVWTITNIGAGTVTIIPTSGSINPGGLATDSLTTGQIGRYCTYDGASWVKV